MEGRDLPTWSLCRGIWAGICSEQLPPNSYFNLTAFTPRPEVPGAARSWVFWGFSNVSWVVSPFAHCWVRVRFSWICSVITFSSAFQLTKLYCYWPLVVLSILEGVFFLTIFENIYLFIYLLAASGLSCGTQDLSLWCVGSSLRCTVVVCGLSSCSTQA